MKKGQVTLFIVIGLVLVVSTILFFSFRSESEQFLFDPVRTEIVEQGPSEFFPVQPFVEKCLHDTSVEGVRLLGERGGYISTGLLRTSRESTEGQGVAFTQGSDLKIPYWFYLADRNSCTGSCEFTSAQLQLKGSNSLETELKHYIEDQFPLCIDNFKSMASLGYEVSVKDDPTVRVTIAASDLVVDLHYPLDVQRLQKKESFDLFQTNLDVDLRSIYDMADYIANLQKEFRFLEKTSLNLVSGFGARDNHMLPPLTDLTFERAGRHRWFKSKVRQQVQGLLTSYIPLLRMHNTPNWEEFSTDSRFADRIYNTGFSMPNENPSQIEVEFSYLDFWDMYFNLNCNGQVCEPESVFFDVLPIGFQRYNFVYDLSFPVLVELYDASAFNNQGYTFQFFLEANVRNNAPMTAEFNPVVPPQDVRDSLFCDENKRTSGDVVIEVTDEITGEGIDDVDVMYACLDSCFVGRTDTGQLDTRLPVCLGGTIVLMKDGYVDAYQSLDVSVDSEHTLQQTMKPLRELNVVVKKQMLRFDGSWKQAGSADLEDYETAVIRMSSPDIPTAFAEVSNDHPDTVEVTVGEYEIFVDIEADLELVIPDQKEDIEGEEITLPGMELDSFPSGRSFSTYTITSEDLEKGTIVLYVTSPDFLGIPQNQRTSSQLTIINNLEEEEYNSLPTFE